MAWLYASPKQNDKDENPKSRIWKFENDDKHNPANNLPYTDSFLAKCFQLSGMCLSGAMSMVPLTWCEVSAFIQTSGYSLSGWESEQIINMSRVYCSFSQDAKELGCPAPYQDGGILMQSADDMASLRDKVAKQWAGFAKDAKPIKRL